MVFLYIYIFFNQTPIHLAVRSKKADVIQILIDAGADVDWEDIFYIYFFLTKEFFFFFFFFLLV